MRTIRPPVLIGLGCAAMFLVIAIGLRHLSLARQRYEASIESLRQLQGDAAEVMRLRSQREVVAWRQRPTTDVLAQVNAALIEAGIPTARLQGIGEGVDTPLMTSGDSKASLHRQSLTITLESLSPAQIGTFLDRWLAIADQWTAGRLELTHRRDDKQSDLYDLRLYIGAVYIAGS